MRNFAKLVSKYTNGKDISLSEKEDSFVVKFDIETEETFKGMRKFYLDNKKYLNRKESGVLKMAFDKSITREV